MIMHTWVMQGIQAWLWFWDVVSSLLGFCRNYVSFDIVRRILEQVFHCPIFQVINITDIDDKIVKRATETGTPWQDVARRFEQSFFDDLASLGVRSALFLPLP
jgi:cysteinyl-tRNA synthetase